jgi:peptidoglycan/xylan/chitin deacetylase (PgdA/CDA1 family)
LHETAVILTTALELSSAAIATAFGTVTWISLSPRNQFWGRVHARGRAGSPARYALTFDDGPTRGPTDAVLDALRDLRAPAAFFVVGVNARRCPDLLLRIRDEGHLIANHTLDHDHYSVLRRRRYWERQLGETDRIVQEVTGLNLAMFRPPMGFKTPHSMRAARRRGHAVITWSRRAFDGVVTTQQQILDRLVPHTTAGDILLLHDGLEPHAFRRDPAATVAALKPLVSRLRDRGLEPVRLDALLNLPAYLTSSSSSPATAPATNW